jgi:hypothetical protein
MDKVLKSSKSNVCILEFQNSFSITLYLGMFFTEMFISSLKMEAVSFSEMLVTMYQTSRYVRVLAGRLEECAVQFEKHVVLFIVVTYICLLPWLLAQYYW